MQGSNAQEHASKISSSINILNTKSNLKPEDYLQVKTIESTSSSASLQIDYKNKAFPLAEELAMQLKQTAGITQVTSQPFLITHKPSSKDFNDDLKLQAEGIHPAKAKEYNTNALEARATSSNILKEKLESKAELLTTTDRPPVVIKDQTYQAHSLADELKTNTKKTQQLAENLTLDMDREDKKTRSMPEGATGKASPKGSPVSKGYNQTLDALEQAIHKEGIFLEAKNKVMYYKNFPHLTDAEVDRYTSVQEKLEKSRQNDRGIEKRQQEIE
jgi:hypothetical protein